MLLLFVNLYRAMLTGTWSPYDNFETFLSGNKNLLNALGTLASSIFGDNQMTTIGDAIAANSYSYVNIIALVLATITSIGIVIMAVKGVKRIFGVFFYGVR